MTNAAVLLVEDNDINRDMLTRRLTRAGLTVIGAADGQTALDMMRSDSPAVVLMDMNTLFGEVPLFLEMSPKFHWGEITKNIDRLDNTFLT